MIPSWTDLFQKKRLINYSFKTSKKQNEMRRQALIQCLDMAATLICIQWKSKWSLIIVTTWALEEKDSFQTLWRLWKKMIIKKLLNYVQDTRLMKTEYKKSLGETRSLKLNSYITIRHLQMFNSSTMEEVHNIKNTVNSIIWMCRTHVIYICAYLIFYSI